MTQVNLDRIRPIVAEFTDIEPSSILGTMTFEDLNLDSLEEVEMMMALEDKWELDLLEYATDFETIGEVADLVATELEKQNG